MTRREIAAQRDKYLLLIRQLGKQRYDARPLLDEFYRLTEEFKKAGGRPAPPTGSLTRKYWEDPENYCLEHENHWPVKVVDGKIVREYVKSTTAPVTTSNLPEQTVSKEVKNQYYRINIVWDGDFDCTKVKQFFEKLCIKQDKQIDKQSLTYTYYGTDEGVKMLKRATASMIEILFPNQNVIVYGKQI